MRSQQNIIFSLILVVSSAIIGYYIYNTIMNFNPTPTAQIVTGEIERTFWEILSYYFNNTTIVVYLKPSDIIDISTLQIYINNQKAEVFPEGYYNGTVVNPFLGGFIEAVANYTPTQYLSGEAIQILITYPSLYVAYIYPKNS